MSNENVGLLAKEIVGASLPLAVLKSNAGFYIGTCMDGIPCSRESVEYFASLSDAEHALETGRWSQKATA